MPYKDKNIAKEYLKNYMKHYRKSVTVLNKEKSRRLARSIERQECSIKHCTNLGERHHPNYLKPLEIVYLCKKHHENIHRKFIICTVNGCNNIHSARGLCGKHWKRNKMANPIIRQLELDKKKLWHQINNQRKLVGVQYLS